MVDSGQEAGHGKKIKLEMSCVGARMAEGECQEEKFGMGNG